MEELKAFSISVTFSTRGGMGVLAINRSDSAYTVAVEPPSNSHSYQIGRLRRRTKLSPNVELS